MGNKHYKTCKVCGRELRANRDYFKRIVDHDLGKEVLSDICRDCEKELEYKKHWDGDKLICLVCGEKQRSV